VISVRERPPALRTKPLEPLQVELPVVEPEGVSRRARFDHPRRQHLAQPRHVRLDHLGGALRRPIAPQLLHETADRDSVVCVEKEHCKERALLFGTEREGSFTLPRLQRPEDPKLHDAPEPGT
jgi:hypothetical protein